MATEQDREYLLRTIRLALRGYGRVSPNPMVGALVVREGLVLGRGWHRGPGLPHAEIEALEDCKRRGYDPAGATMYISLEPCSTWGRTPPCTDAIVAHRIGRVVVGAVDPNPAHAGRGLKILQQNGIQAELLPLPQAEALLIGFHYWIAHRRPWVILKFASSLDGRIGTETGESKWITGPRSRGIAMRLRQGVDAILVGVGTILADDPALTVRWGDRYWIRQPWRIVLDPRARIPLEAQVLNDRFASRTLVAVGPQVNGNALAALRRRGVSVWQLPEIEPGILDLHELLRRLGEQGVTRLLVEGGGRTHAQFLAQRAAHELWAFYAPILLGGRRSPLAIAAPGVAHLQEAYRLEGLRMRRCGPDLLVCGQIKYPSLSTTS